MNFLNKLRRDETGAVMTEFVIALPIFIIIFVGMANLYKIESDSVRTKLRASVNMWDAAIAVHGTSDFFAGKHGIPAWAAADASGIISNVTNNGASARLLAKNGQLAGNGTEGEASSIAAGGAGTVPSSNFDFAGKMVSDSFIDPLPPTSKTSLFMWNIAVLYSLGHTRHAGAIGTRYGIVEGTDTRSGTLTTGLSYSFTNGYNVLVSPKLQRGGEFKVIGFSRLTAEESDCLESVLEISNDVDYDC